MASNSQVSSFSGSGVRNAIIKKAFNGKKNIFDHIIVTTASPNGTVTSGFVGCLAWDETAGDAYINTDTGTTWVKINA